MIILLARLSVDKSLDYFLYLRRVHLVDGDDELTDTEGEGQEGVLAGLAILGDTGFELTGTTSNDEDGTVGLRGTSDHVLDEVTVTGSINDLAGDEDVASAAWKGYVR